MADAEEVLTTALEEALGAAIVLDAQLRVLAWTPRTEELVGPMERMVPAPALLCGAGEQRPVAEALAEGRAVTAEVPRPTASGRMRMLHVRASPLERAGERLGWLLALEGESWESTGPDEPVEMWGMATRSPLMKKLFRDVERVAKRNVTVLGRGETGSGKELVANAIHEASRRSGGPFRAINCAALPPNLLESELFGHVRGAFTGAVRDAPGHFRLAEGGTLFLDEVGELSLDLQAKLLRVLQEKTVIPVGGREPVPVDVRIVSATNRSLREMIDEGTFREDLMYRLRVIPLFIPPLRERPEDVTLLARRFLDELADDMRKIDQISHGAAKLLESWEWPGNVRELRNVIEYAFAMGEGSVLLEADLPPEIRGEDPMAPTVNVPERLPEGASSEEKQLRRALERAGGHRGRAASILGISRSTLWRKMKQHGLLEDD